MTPEEAAEKLDCHVSTIHRYIRKEKIEAEKVKRISENNWRYEIPKKEIEKIDVQNKTKTRKKKNEPSREEIYKTYIENENMDWYDIAQCFNMSKKRAMKKGFQFFNLWIKNSNDKNKTKDIKKINKTKCCKCIWSTFVGTQRKKSYYHCLFNRCIKEFGWKLEKGDNDGSSNKEKIS